MGWWSSEILGGDPPLDTIDALARDVLGMQGVGLDFDCDEETAVRVRDKAADIEAFVLERFACDKDAYASGLALTYALLGRMLGVECGAEIDALAATHIHDLRGRTGESSFGRALASALDEIEAFVVRAQLERQEVRTVFGLLWTDRRFLAPACDTLASLVSGEDEQGRPRTLEGMVDVVWAEATRTRPMVVEQIARWRERIPAFDREGAVGVQAGAALLLSVGARLSPQMIDALMAAITLDTHPRARHPERQAVLAHLLQTARAQDARTEPTRASFSNEGLGGAFERAAAEGRTGLLNL